MQRLFKNLGLSAKETETFLKLLELGAQPVSIIARHVHIPRSSMYLVLDNLKALGLIEAFDRAGVKYFKCIPARRIAEVIKAKERKLQATLELLEAELPYLEKLENTLSITPKIKFFEGEEVFKMYEEVLEEHEFCALFNPELAKKVVPAYYRQIPIMLRERRGKARELITASTEGREYQQTNDSPYHRIKILPKEIKLSSDTIICRDRIYLVSYGENQISATEIYSNALAESQLSLFEYWWKKL